MFKFEQKMLLCDTTGRAVACPNINKMPPKSKLNSDIHFRLLNLVSEDPHVTQRVLAKKLGISLGAVNYCLKELIKVGHIKVDNFKKNSNKLRYFYLITPKGIQEKSALTVDFLKRKLAEFHDLKREIKSIQQGIKNEL